MPKPLPLEIWWNILREVAYLHGALEDSVTTRFEWFGWQYREASRYQESMTNKLSLVKVCKAWYWESIKLLYEDIRLMSVQKLERLHAALCASSQIGNRHPHGWWTQRLDFPERKINDPLMHAFITHFPNLRILLFPDIDSIPDTFPPRHLLPKLRYTHLDSDHGDHALTNLYTLTLVLRDNPKSSFPNLTALEIFSDYLITSFPPSCSFPNLRHLTIINIMKMDLLGLVNFLERHGHQLLSFCIHSTALYPEMGLLLSRTPNLLEFIYPYCEKQPSYDTRPYPSVTHIGLVDCWNPEYRIEAVMDPFLDISRFPNIKCIKLLNTSFPILKDPTDAARYKAWYEGSQFVQRGVLYEDAERNSLLDVIDEALRSELRT